MQYSLEVKNLKKYFGSVKANDGIDLRVEEGSIHAIVGENGAGKTTMVRSISGLYQPDEGEIHVFGEKVKFQSPQEAFKKGIGILHQHFMLVEDFTVLENILLGAEPKSRIVLKKAEGRKEVERICKDYSLEIDLNAKVGELPVGLQQRVEILKILYRGAKLIILDEPTAVLTPQEIESFFSILRYLTDSGCSIIFITHKLKEVMEVSDHVTVIRDGKTVANFPTKEANEKILANNMVGRDVLLEVKKEDTIEIGEEILKVEHLKVQGINNNQGLEDISFSIKEGEIFGIIGVAGNGQEAIVESILGLQSVESGNIEIHGEKTHIDKPSNFRKRGDIGCIPSDRLKEGLIKEFNVMENSYLGFQNDDRVLSRGFLSRKKINEWAKKIVKDNGVKIPQLDSSINNLSGGNQQKLIIGRELHTDPKLILAVQPTRGVDIGAIEFIYKNLLERRKEKTAILLISNELEEVLSLADKIAVLFRGKIMGVGKPSDYTREEIGLMMAGIDLEDRRSESYE